MNMFSGAPSSNPFAAASTLKAQVDQNLTGTEEVGDANQVNDQEHHRVSLLDETIVVKHINDSAITKDHESFSLVESSINDENFLIRPAVDTREHIMNMFDASKMDNSSVSYSRQNAIGTIQHNSASLSNLKDSITV